MALALQLLVVPVVVLVLCFSFVLLFGAPFLPTLRPQIEAALDLLGLKAGDTLLELGCGDGRVLIAAAERGLNAVGYELNPVMAMIAWVRTRHYGKQIRVVWGDYWRVQWPAAEGIFAFILSRYMRKLDKKVAQYPHKPIKVASFAFEIPDKQPSQTKNGIFLYIYK